MRLTSRPAQSQLEQRRERARRRRAAAGSLAESFPDVERIRIRLTFADPVSIDPVTQTHDLFPPASMIIEFACPHGDCDGSFDLSDVAAGVLSKGSRTATGELRCNGSRSAPEAQRQACALALRYRFAAVYRERGR